MSRRSRPARLAVRSSGDDSFGNDITQGPESIKNVTLLRDAITATSALTFVVLLSCSSAENVLDSPDDGGRAADSSGSTGTGATGARGGSSGAGGSASGMGGGGSGNGGAGTGGSAGRGGASGSAGSSATGGSAGTSDASSGGSRPEGGVGGSDANPDAGTSDGRDSDGGGSDGAAGGGDSASDVRSDGGGSDGGGSDGGQPSVCAFASGLNVAWVRFANDIPSPDISTFNAIFQNTYNAGGRAIRWWFHTNGAVTPGYDASGNALPIPPSHIDGVKSILNAANANKVKLIISLWSFDMLQANAGAAHTNNSLLLEDDSHRQAYIDNYLTPLVNGVKGTPGLYAWEIFNEPEGMGPNGWATYRTTLPFIQKTVNWLAAAIRAADPTALVTNSAVTFDYCSNIAGKTNYYSDSALRTVGGKQNGTLDFYQVHYYAVNGTSNSAFLHPASYWALDKKLVMGEFATIDTDGVQASSIYTYLYDNGYAGAWAWAYNSDWPWPSMQAPMQSLYDAHPNEVGGCP